MPASTNIADVLGWQPDERWTPRAEGDGFCAPACGGGCRHIAFIRAVRESRDLARRMGAGWQPDVWENLGWHYAVHKGRARILPISSGDHIAGTWTISGYRARIDSVVEVREHATDPENALGFAVQSARGKSRQIAQDLDDILDDAAGGRGGRR